MAAADVIWNIMIVFMVLNTIAVGLRVYTRTQISHSFGYDDWAMAAAYAGFVLLCAFAFKSISSGYGRGAVTLDGAKFFVICQVTWAATLIMSKISAALVLYRIASHNSRIRHVIEVSTVLYVMSMTGLTFVLGLQCRPLSAAWGETTGQCLSAVTITNVAFAMSGLDIALSWLHAILPAYMIWNSQMATSTKVSVIFLLGLGVVSNVATIIRLSGIIDISTDTTAKASEIPEKLLTTFIYSVTEVGLTVLTASLTALRPLLRLVPFFGSSTAGTDAGTGDRFSGRTPKPTDSMGANRAFKNATSALASGAGRPVQLEDLCQFDDAGSQETILGNGREKGRIRKQTEYEVKHDSA
jgi:hypothetical protein